jgi:membrane fusion protein, multidrug efflux system
MSSPMYRPFTVLLLPLVAVCGIAACGGDAAAVPESSTPPVPVSLVQVQQDSVALPVTGTGTYGSRDEVALAFKIGGVIARLAVDDGDAVQRGQLLASLDLREIDAMRRKAQVAVDKATRDVTRLRSLVADSVATRAQLQDAESALAAAEADLATAEVNREYAVITAPGNGRVLRRSTQPGALVAPGQEILYVANDTRGRMVRVGLPERDAVRVREGQSATITFDALPDRTFPGRVMQRGAATDPRTGAVMIEVSVIGADAMPTGAVARVQIDVPSSALLLLVPVEALLEADGDSATVFVERDGRAYRQRVRVLSLAGARVGVQGIDASARVIGNGAAYLTDSAAVRIVDGAQ